MIVIESVIFCVPMDDMHMSLLPRTSFLAALRIAKEGPL